jgi:hypothetical protein
LQRNSPITRPMLELRSVVREIGKSRDVHFCFKSDVNKTVRRRLFDLDQRPREFLSQKLEMSSRAFRQALETQESLCCCDAK